MQNWKKLCMAEMLLIAGTIIFADNPIVQTNYTADPAPMAYKDKVYLYTSHDEDITDSNFYTMRNYCLYSSSDMANWTDHGIVASLKDFKWIGSQNNGAWAPQCIERGGKFYLYIPVRSKGVAVLVSDSPTGPFTDPIGKSIINRGDWNDIDPTAFFDSSSGQAYLYWGNGSLSYVKLKEDMTSFTGSISSINPKPSGYVEGPWFYKRNSLYYMLYAGSGTGGSENLQYATSNSPTGPWSSKGAIMPTQGSSFTNHPGICDFKDNSYLFYHDASLNGGGSFKRSVRVEQFTYKDDGSIPSMTMTKDGPTQVGSLNPYDTVQAETICWSSGLKTEKCNEGGINVTSISNGDYIKVKGVGFGSTGAKLFEARVASSTSGGKIELRIDSQSGTLIGTCDVSGTGGTQTWTTKTCTISGVTGKKDLYMKFTGGNGTLFNFNWWKFQQDQTSTSLKCVLNKNAEIKYSISGRSGANIMLSFSLPSNIGKNRIKINLYDISGRFMHSANVEDSYQNQRANIPGIHSGIYLVRLFSGNKQIKGSDACVVIK